MAPDMILSVLSRPNPTPRTWCVGMAPNTENRAWLEVSDWKPWKEFKYKKLRAMFKGIVEAPWEDAPDDTELSYLDTIYGNEDGFEHQILSPEIIKLVNIALGRAQNLAGHSARLHLGRAGRCKYEEDSRFIPDWILVSDDGLLDSYRYEGIMPGDTKLSPRWRPDLDRSSDQWQKPVAQVLTYSDDLQSRYGFLVTDKELVVFQFAKEHIGTGLASARGIRSAPAQGLHQRGLSDISELSGSLQNMSISGRSYGAQSYVDTGKGLEYQDPKYCIIPWSNSGKGVLTVRLGLFYLCLMAGYGSADVRTRYPKLDTWCKLSDGSFQHNTLGHIKRKLDANDEEEASEDEEGDAADEGGDEGYPEETPREPAGPGWDEYTNDYGAGEEQMHEEAEVSCEVGFGTQRWDNDDGEEEEEEEEGVAGKAGKGRRKAKAKEVKAKSLPKLGTKKAVVAVDVWKDGNRYCFTSRKKKTALVKKHEWTPVEFKGRHMLMFEGTETCYITERLPA